MGACECAAAGKLRGGSEIPEMVLNAHTKGWLLHLSPTRNSLLN